MIFGQTESNSNGSSDVWLIKTDENGNLIWDQNFGGSNVDVGRRGHQTSEGGFIIGGWTKSYGSGMNDVLLVKTDSLGNLEFLEAFGGLEDDEGYAVQETNNGYMLFGRNNSNSSGISDFWLIHTNFLGNLDLISGCTDQIACNYNSQANSEDGSCHYPDTSFTEVTACESYEWNEQTYTESGTYEYSEQNINEYSLSFDGVDDYVELNNLNNTLNNFSDFSFIGHFKTDGSNSSPQQLIFSTVDNSYDAASIWLGIKNNQILLKYFDGSTHSDYLYYGNNLSDNQWHYIALSLDNQGDLFIYIDGIQVAHEISVQVDFNSANYFSLGHDWDPGPVPSDLFIGNLDNVAIWDIPLTSQDINQYMNCPPTGNEEGLIGYWNFEEAEGQTVIDLSENGNDGIINGASYSTNTPNQSCQLTTVNGCDSVAVLDLTITQPDTSFTEVTACESYEWNEQTYTESGTYEYSEQNINEYSLSFDGVDDYVELNNLNNTLNNFSDFSFIGHFKTDGSNSSPQQLIFSTVDNSYDAASIWLGIKNNQILLKYFDGSTHSDYLYYGNNLSDNQWHYIALSLDNQGDLFIYIDGIQVAHEISVQVDLTLLITLVLDMIGTQDQYLLIYLSVILIMLLSGIFH